MSERERFEEGMPGLLKAMRWAYDNFYIKGYSNSDEREGYISALEDDLPVLFGQVDDLVALVARLARSLRKAAPADALADRALDYLRRKGLSPSPLRTAEPPQAASGSQESARSDVLSIDVVEQRLLTWRQRFMNKSGDRLALDDFMGQESIDDLIDFVCAPPAQSAEQGATPPAPVAPPGHWDEYAMREARRLWNLPAMPKGQLVASLHCALIDAMRFAASPQPAAPEGWKLVPIEATPEMVQAYLRANDAYWHRTDALPDKLGVWRQGTPTEATAESYRAMLAAAPAAEGGAS